MSMTNMLSGAPNGWSAEVHPPAVICRQSELEAFEVSESGSYGLNSEQKKIVFKYNKSFNDKTGERHEVALIVFKNIVNGDGNEHPVVSNENYRQKIGRQDFMARTDILYKSLTVPLVMDIEPIVDVPNQIRIKVYAYLKMLPYMEFDYTLKEFLIDVEGYVSIIISEDKVKKLEYRLSKAETANGRGQWKTCFERFDDGVEFEAVGPDTA